jgi:hypothetical protein
MVLDNVPKLEIPIQGEVPHHFELANNMPEIPHFPYTNIGTLFIVFSKEYSIAKGSLGHDSPCLQDLISQVLLFFGTFTFCQGI